VKEIIKDELRHVVHPNLILGSEEFEKELDEIAERIAREIIAIIRQGGTHGLRPEHYKQDSSGELKS